MKMLARRSSCQSGLTLVEIMVALAISLLLVAGVIQIFLSNKATFRLQEGLGRMQENSRFALEFLTRDIRQAGYLGCSPNTSSFKVRLDEPPDSFVPLAGVEGWEFIGTAPGQDYDINPTDVVPQTSNGKWITTADTVLPADLDVLDGSDILRIWYTVPVLSDIVSVEQGIPITIEIESTSAIKDGDFIVLSDCGNSNLLQVCNVGTSGDNTTLTIDTTDNRCVVGNDLGDMPDLDSLVGKGEISVLKSSIFFLGKRANDPQNPPSLYYLELDGSDEEGGDDGSVNPAQKEELVEGVDSMQILYGLDRDADQHVNRYVTADAVDSWQNVVAVQISLLMNTVSEADTQPHGGIYNVNGTNLNIIPKDRRPRKIYTTTIQLRNRST